MANDMNNVQHGNSAQINGGIEGPIPKVETAADAPLDVLKKSAYATLRDAEKAWHAYFAECDVGPERIFASNVYEILRTAPREGRP